jgi:hypothetical protein
VFLISFVQWICILLQYQRDIDRRKLKADSVLVVFPLIYLVKVSHTVSHKTQLVDSLIMYVFSNRIIFAESYGSVN